MSDSDSYDPSARIQGYFDSERQAAERLSRLDEQLRKRAHRVVDYAVNELRTIEEPTTSKLLVVSRHTATRSVPSGLFGLRTRTESVDEERTTTIYGHWIVALPFESWTCGSGDAETVVTYHYSLMVLPDLETGLVCYASGPSPGGWSNPPRIDYPAHVSSRDGEFITRQPLRNAVDSVVDRFLQMPRNYIRLGFDTDHPHDYVLDSMERGVIQALKVASDR